MPELKKELKRHGLEGGGAKSILVGRLVKHVAHELIAQANNFALTGRLLGSSAPSSNSDQGEGGGPAAASTAPASAAAFEDPSALLRRQNKEILAANEAAAEAAAAAAGAFTGPSAYEQQRLNNMARNQCVRAQGRGGGGLVGSGFL